MRNVLMTSLAVMLVLGFSGLANAEDQIKAAGGRLVGGAEDAALGWTELPKEMYEEGKKNPLLGVTTAPITGAKETVLRTTEGALETGLFVFPESDQPYEHREAGRPMGKRLMDGVTDAAIGWTELPKEMYEEGKKNPLLGVTVGAVRGAEKTAIRTTEGALETGTFYVPESSTSHHE